MSHQVFNMKNYISLLSIILTITSCDIEEGMYNENYNSYVNPDKKVLIEDFTGHKCPNCPNAARELEAIHDIYGDQIIGMAIHVSSFAKPTPNPFTYDFRTNWGDDWDEFYGISLAGLPRGMINRTGFGDDSHKLGKDEWGTVVANELKKQIDFKISISSNPVDSTISITSLVQNNINSEYNLVVCLTESNIINWQKDGQENVEDYQHNHVLRTVLIDQTLSNSTNYTAGQQIEETISYNLADLEEDNIFYSLNTAEMGNGNAGDWNKDNINIVAYIYNTNTKEILQVEEANLITK